MSAARLEVIHGDAKYTGRRSDDIELMWTDPPFTTGKVMSGRNGSYKDVKGHGYIVDAINSWLPHISDDATIVICCDYRLAPHLVADIDWVYRGEIIWEFGLGRPRNSWWPVRHNNLLTFTRTRSSGRFDKGAMPRERRLAQKPGYPTSKPAGSVWQFTMSNTHPERTGYPNQKPIEIIKPFVLAHTRPGDTVLDPFCGSGSTGYAARQLGRGFVGIDTNKDAIDIASRLLV